MNEITFNFNKIRSAMRSLWDREFSHIFSNEWHSPAGHVPYLIFCTALEILVLYALFTTDICITESILRGTLLE